MTTIGCGMWLKLSTAAAMKSTNWASEQFNVTNSAVNQNNIIETYNGGMNLTSIQRIEGSHEEKHL